MIHEIEKYELNDSEMITLLIVLEKDVEHSVKILPTIFDLEKFELAKKIRKMLFTTDENSKTPFDLDEKIYQSLKNQLKK